MTSPGEEPVDALRRLAGGHQVSQAIHVAATLGIADLLASGPRTAGELAAEAGADERSLYRLLRALASIGVFREEDGRRFASTPLSDGLRRDAPETLHGWTALIGRPPYWLAWGDLLHSIRTGENAFTHVHGTDVWTYRAGKPEESAIFDRAMADISARLLRSLVTFYDFGRFDSIVDVGGGNGTLLAALLGVYPTMRGVVFDQPHVVTNAQAVLEAAGVADRCEIVAGDFFESVPAGYEAYMLKSIVHDWEDPEAARILESCRRASQAGAALLVVEHELGGPNENPAAKFSDLNMLVAPGGCERSTDDYASLMQAAGFRFVGTTPTSSGWQVLEGVAE